MGDYILTTLFKFSCTVLNWETCLELSGKIVSSKKLSSRCFEHSVKYSSVEELEKYRSRIIPLSKKLQCDICIQPNDGTHRTKKLVVFDMDSTLIQQEVIDMIAAYAGVEDQVSVSNGLQL